MIRTLSIIGGGSAYTPGLIKALIDHADQLDLREIRLHDIDHDHLELVARLCARMARAASAPFSVAAARDPVAAVQDADAILNSARPGGLASRRIDEQLPLRYGIPGQETVGPGGFFFALRSVPQALRLAAIASRHAPEAVFLNYTNPTNIVAQALVDAFPLKVIALCDQAEDDLGTLARALGHPSRRLSFRCTGLNHATWYSRIRFGRHPLPARLEALPVPGGLDREHRLRFSISSRLARQRPGLWPNSYLPYYTEPDRFVALYRREGTRSQHILAGLPRFYDHFREESRKEDPRLRHFRGGTHFGDLALRVLLALGRDRGRRLVLNVPNRGMSELFAPDTVIEAVVGLGRGGLQRRPAPGLPADQQARLKRLETYQRLAADAIRANHAGRAVEALGHNPLVQNRRTAGRLMEAAAREYGPAVPMFR